MALVLARVQLADASRRRLQPLNAQFFDPVWLLTTESVVNSKAAACVNYDTSAMVLPSPRIKNLAANSRGGEDFEIGHCYRCYF